MRLADQIQITTKNGAEGLGLWPWQSPLPRVGDTLQMKRDGVTYKVVGVHHVRYEVEGHAYAAIEVEVRKMR
jgi:hypothetical protein